MADINTVHILHDNTVHKFYKISSCIITSKSIMYKTNPQVLVTAPQVEAVLTYKTILFPCCV